MERISLLIGDENREYIDLLMKFIRETENSKKFNIKTVSSKENFELALQKNTTTDILLTIPEFVSEKTPLDKVKVTILLTENLKSNNYSEKANLPTLFKYQPLNQLLNKILTIYAENSETGKLKAFDDKKLRLITISSGVGGVGKTTLAINLASNIALRDKKVFYLNLELYNSTEIFFPSTESDDLSKISYYIRTDPLSLKNKIDELKKYDFDTKIEYFEPFTNPIELFDFNSEDLHRLIDSIKELGRHDYLIIDLEQSKTDLLTTASIMSDYIIWLVTDNILNLHKTKLFKKTLENSLNENSENVFDKSLFVMNKFNENNIQNTLSDLDINLFGYLPYIHEWEYVVNKNQLLNNLTFNSSLNNLFSKLLD